MIFYRVYIYSTTAAAVTRDLFKLLFTTEELITHSLAGNRCPAMPSESEVLPGLDDKRKAAIFSKKTSIL